MELSPNVIDRTGMRYGRLIAIKHVGTDKKRQALWECVCDCGDTGVIVCGHNLSIGKTKSCGCLRRENANKVGRDNQTHGMTHSRLFSIWNSMKTRCTNPNHERWSRYGGRGISVSEHWFDSFDSFLNDMEESYNSHVAEFGVSQTTLDRIDNDKGYYPENCRWATRREQNLNRGVIKKQKEGA